MRIKRLFLMLVALMMMCNAVALSKASIFDVLRGLDIDISEDAERAVRDEMEESLAQYSQYMEYAGRNIEVPAFDDYTWVMTYLGMGVYEPETDSFVPLTNGLYAFDMEMTWVEEGYELLLDAVERMSGGSIDIEDIRIEIDDAVFEAGWGEFPLRFTMNGEAHEYTLRLTSDWMDISVLDRLNEDLAQYGDPRRLWFLYDEGQGMILFYRDRTWVEKFQSVTGLRLMDHTGESPVGDLGEALGDWLAKAIG